MCEMRDALAVLDRRCVSAESALHGAVSYGQVIDAIRSTFGPFREQVTYDRLSICRPQGIEASIRHGKEYVSQND